LILYIEPNTKKTQIPSPALIKNRTAQADCAGGYMFSDFPQSLSQAQTFDQVMLDEEKATGDDVKANFRCIELKCSDEVRKWYTIKGMTILVSLLVSNSILKTID
jgi:hypothetical protein